MHSVRLKITENKMNCIHYGDESRWCNVVDDICHTDIFMGLLLEIVYEEL